MRIIKPLPALCALYSKQGFIKDLAGVRAMARAVLFCGSESPLTDTGEIIFSENGVSGIPIMSLSSLCIKEAVGSNTDIGKSGYSYESGFPS